MPQAFTRDRFTWLAYLLLAFYSYFLNILGPVTPFLKDELHLSYTVSSLHFSAFAVGILVIGLAGHLVIQRTGRIPALWIGAAGLSLGALLLSIGQTPVVTVSAAFLMGCVGSLILAVVPAALSDRHGEQRAVAISEANVISSLFAAGAPLLVGWLAGTLLGWRAALAGLALLPLLLRILTGRGVKITAAVQNPASSKPSGKDSRNSSRSSSGKDSRRLPALYWFTWAAIVLVVSVEFCMIFWSADYLERRFGMPRSAAAQAVSLFLIAMIVGRLACSRLVQRFPARMLVSLSILLALAGFCAYWTASAAWLGLTGLFLCGLGVAGLYPLTLSMAIATAGPQADQAGARASLASGTAILALPLLLGRLADAAGIRPAYLVVAVLLVAALGLVYFTAKLFPEINRSGIQSDLETSRTDIGE